MKDSYTQEVEKQNEKLRTILDDTTQKLVKAEETIAMFDFLPTFVLNHAEKSLIPNYRHSPSIHQNLTSTLEILSDMVGDSILTDVERKNSKSRKGKKQRVIKIISTLELQCWYIGSLERTYVVDVGRIKEDEYDVYVHMTPPCGIITPQWDEKEDKWYLSKLPKNEEIRNTIIEDFEDCRIMSKYIKDK